MPLIKYYFTLLLLISLISITYSSSEDPVKDPITWDPESLFQFTKDRFFNYENPRRNQNLQYMIVDPEGYLNNADLKEAYKYMEILHSKYNVSNHVFIVSKMKNKYGVDEAIAYFVSKLCYLLYKDNSLYDDKKTLTTVFFIKDRKMRMRTSKQLREVITDFDASEILKNRKNDLKKNNFEAVVNGLMKNIYNTYKYNLEHPTGFFEENKVIITTISIIICVTIFIVILNNEYKTSTQEQKVNKFLDKLKYSKNPKKIVAESCIICLEDLKSQDEINKLSSTEKEKEEISTLECGHQFHRKCITNWLKKETNCPICRMNFNIDDKKKNNYDRSENENEPLNENTLNFGNLLAEILRIQSDSSFLSGREIRRIRRNYGYEEKGSNYRSFYNDVGGREGGSSSFGDFDRGSGGATEGW